MEIADWITLFEEIADDTKKAGEELESSGYGDLAKLLKALDKIAREADRLLETGDSRSDLMVALREAGYIK